MKVFCGSEVDVDIEEETVFVNEINVVSEKVISGFVISPRKNAELDRVELFIFNKSDLASGPFVEIDV